MSMIVSVAKMLVLIGVLASADGAIPRESWDWAMLTLVQKDSGREPFVTKGTATVTVVGKSVQVLFHDPRVKEGTEPASFSGTIGANGLITGNAKGFDYDFDHEPLIGVYRSRKFPDGCVAHEIVFKDRSPRRRVLLMSQEICAR